MNISGLVRVVADEVERDDPVPRVLGRLGEPGELFSWDDFDELLESHHFDSACMRVVRDGVALPPAAYVAPIFSLGPRPAGFRIDQRRIARELSRGGSFVVDGSETLSAKVRRLTDELGRVLGCTVTANLYASFGIGKAFPRHWDAHEVVVVQIAGDREWTLHRPSEPYPVLRRGQQPPGPTAEPALSRVITEGEMLYIPRGCWHSVHGAGQRSIHLSLSFRRRSTADLLRLLDEMLEAQEIGRRDLNTRNEGQAQATAQTWISAASALLASSEFQSAVQKVISEDAGPPAGTDVLDSHLLL